MVLEKQEIEALRQKSLQDWLHLPQFDILIEVLASKAFEAEVQSANELSKWHGGVFPQYQEAALKTARDATQLNICINILNALRETNDPYTKSTATPT